MFRRVLYQAGQGTSTYQTAEGLQGKGRVQMALLGFPEHPFLF